MSGRSQRQRAMLLFLVFILGLLPGCSPLKSSARSHDDAMLLMIASQVRLAGSLEDESLASVHGQMSLRPVGIAANGNTINEVVGLIELYRRHQDTLEGQKDQYTDRQYEFVKSALNDKISDLEQQASSLTKRRRRRGFNPFKVIGRGIGKLAKGIGKGVKFVVVEGGKLAIHFVVNKVKTTIRDVFEGRVNSIIARFVGRFGPLSPWVEARLRRVLDRWWVGFRDRVSGRASRYATQTAEAGLDLELGEEQEPETVVQPAEPEDEVEVLPVISASGNFSEILSGPVNTSRPMGVNFQLQANYVTGKINGNLTGGRTTSGNPVECVSNEDPSIVYDTAFVDYIDSYTASFNGTIDPENGDFNIKIVPKGGTTDRQTTPFTVEGCLHLNSQPAPGSAGWTGDGTISGYVTKDGFIDLKTYWTSFGGQIEVTGTWSGPGTVETP